jgi:hypothetical protein
VAPVPNAIGSAAFALSGKRADAVIQKIKVENTVNTAILQNPKTQALPKDKKPASPASFPEHGFTP